MTVPRSTALYVLREHYGLTVPPRAPRPVIAAMLERENTARGYGHGIRITVLPENRAA